MGIGRHGVVTLLYGGLWGLSLDSLDGAFGLTGTTLTGFTAGLFLAGCLLAGYERYRVRSSGGIPIFESTASYAGFWALHYVFLWLALAAFGEPDLPGVSPLLPQVVTGLGLLATSAVVIRHGDVNTPLDPRKWVRQYRAGKRDALSD